MWNSIGRKEGRDDVHVLAFLGLAGCTYISTGLRVVLGFWHRICKLRFHNYIDQGGDQFPASFSQIMFLQMRWLISKRWEICTAWTSFAMNNLYIISQLPNTAGFTVRSAPLLTLKRSAQVPLLLIWNFSHLTQSLSGSSQVLLKLQNFNLLIKSQYLFSMLLLQDSIYIQQTKFKDR